MPHTASRQALCIGITTFGHTGEREPETGALGGLPFAADRADAVHAALHRLDYTCTTAGGEQLPSAKALGRRVLDMIESGQGDDVHVVHVVSHGVPHPSGVYVAGADGQLHPDTSVTDWIRRIEDARALETSRRKATTLFLVDTCHAGRAAHLAWLPAARPGTRAWVIAATTPTSELDDGVAYDGVFSQAVAEVLTEIADGRIDLYPSEYVKFGDLVELIRARVIRLQGHRQYVDSTPVSGNPELPFVPNPRTPTDPVQARAFRSVDTTTRPFLDVDISLDPAHFTDRASGRRLGTRLAQGCFTGRTQELTSLSDWLARGPGSLRVVTGQAGSGKSAVLGILVCAAHPRLREATGRLWNNVPPRALPPPIPMLAAVHLRERGPAAALEGLACQLDLPAPSGEDAAAARTIVAAITRLAQPPVIIVDALDEATDQQTILDHLLLPLAQAVRAGGAPACRLLVGMRPWPEFHSLRDLADAQGGLLNLDDVPPGRLRTELTDYVADLLSLTWQESPALVRKTAGRAVAAALLTRGGERGGEFLAAALYANWLADAHPDGITLEQASALAARVPRTIPDLLDLDLSTRAPGTEAVHAWTRHVLGVLGQAHGAGMPASVIRRLAPLLRPDAGAVPELAGDLLKMVMERIRFYLRSSPDTDGTVLYRLFHQSLVDHLRIDDGRLSGLYDRLVETAPISVHGRRRFEAAEPYVTRHAARHAADAGRLDELLHTDPAELAALFNTTVTQAGSLAAAIWRQSQARHDPADASSRRDLLGIDAARYGARHVLDHLADAAGVPSPTWWPRWATGGQIAAPQLANFGRTASVQAVACAVLEGRPVAVTGGGDATVRVWDLAEGRQLGAPLTGHADIVLAVACAVLEGRPVAVSGSNYDGTVRVWDLAGGGQLGDPLTGHTGKVSAVACAVLGGRPVAVTGGGDATVRVWDLTEGRQLGDPLTGHTGQVPAVACTVLGGRPVAVTGSVDATVRVWDLTEGRQLGDPLTGHTGQVPAVACTVLGGRPVAVTGSVDATVRVWDLTEGRQLGDPLTGHTGAVWAVACTVLGGRPVAVTGGVDGSVRVWDLTWHQGITRLDLPDKVGTLAITPGGELLVGFGWEIACLYPIGRIR